ncbi:MAG: hypothetical protein HKN37_08255 [Rhodothermales bacterium]|nr:hypothetical protein [Rhodothermales bacterium]
MKLLVSGWLVLLAIVIVESGFPLVAPFRHLLGVVDGTISPSSGNLGVVAGEFVILAAVAAIAYVFLRCAAKILDTPGEDTTHQRQ